MKTKQKQYFIFHQNSHSNVNIIKIQLNSDKFLKVLPFR